MSVLLIALLLSASEQLPPSGVLESPAPITSAEDREPRQDGRQEANPQQANPQQANPQDEKNPSVLQVQPGQEAIKKKDFYERSGYLHPFRRMPGFVLVEQEKIWSSPFRTPKKNVKWWAIWGGATGVLIATDRYTQKNAPTNSTLVRMGNDASYLGESYTLLPIAAGFYFIGTAKGSDHFRETGMLSFETVADVAILQLVLKGALGRERPTEGHGNGAFEQSPNRLNSSFPSGHSMTTFAMGSILAHEYPRKWWIKALIYSYGAGVAAARLAAERHFPGDVVAGGVMGWFVGDYVYGKRHNPELEKKTGTARAILSHIQFGGGY